MYCFSLAWSTSTEWRCEKVPRPESWPLSRTGVPSASSVPNASASPVAQSMSLPVSIVLRFSCSSRTSLRLRSKSLGGSESAWPISISFDVSRLVTPLRSSSPGATVMPDHLPSSQSALLGL